jgi:hypothetical protein
MVGADSLVLSVIILASIQNFLFDVFFEVLLEEAVVYLRRYLPDFSIPGLDRINETSMAVDGAELPALIKQLASNPQVIDRLSVEQLEQLNIVLLAMQVAG